MAKDQPEAPSASVPEAPTPAPEAVPADSPAEQGGRGGLEPTRYGDWEKGGIAVDF